LEGVRKAVFSAGWGSGAVGGDLPEHAGGEGALAGAEGYPGAPPVKLECVGVPVVFTSL
jgi:hypothetical protein